MEKQADPSSALSAENIKAIAPYLLAGGVGAVGGGMLTGRRKKRQGETRGQYVGRVLRNALLLGGAAGGGTYLAAKGIKAIGGDETQKALQPSGEPQRAALAQFGRDAGYSPLTAGLAGTAAAVGTAKANKGALGAATSELLTKLKKGDTGTAVLDGVTDRGGLQHNIDTVAPDKLRSLLYDNVTKGEGGVTHASLSDNRAGLLRRAGISPKLREGAGAYEKVRDLGRRYGTPIIGGSKVRRAGSLAAILAAAWAPSAVTTALTDKDS